MTRAATGRNHVLTWSDYRDTPVGVERWPGVRIATWSLDDEQGLEYVRMYALEK